MQHQHTEPVDEQGVQDAHNQAYSQGNAGSLGASSMGAAAAMQVRHDAYSCWMPAILTCMIQAMKMFTSGGGSSGGGSMETQLISMAMSEASNLFDSSGGAASGNKQDAVNGAAMTVMKLLVQSKMGGGVIGGGSSGGLGSLMGLVSSAS